MSRGPYKKKDFWKCVFCNEQRPSKEWDWYFDKYRERHGKECSYKPYNEPCKGCRDNDMELRQMWPTNLNSTRAIMLKDEGFRAELTRIIKIVHDDMEIDNPNNGDILLNKHRKRRGLI